MDGGWCILEVVGLHGGPLTLRVKPQMVGREVRQMLVEQLGCKKGAMTRAVISGATWMEGPRGPRFQVKYRKSST